MVLALLTSACGEAPAAEPVTAGQIAEALLTTEGWTFEMTFYSTQGEVEFTSDGYVNYPKGEAEIVLHTAEPVDGLQRILGDVVYVSNSGEEGWDLLRFEGSALRAGVIPGNPTPAVDALEALGDGAESLPAECATSDNVANPGSSLLFCIDREGRLERLLVTTDDGTPQLELVVNDVDVAQDVVPPDPDLVTPAPAGPADVLGTESASSDASIEVPESSRAVFPLGAGDATSAPAATASAVLLDRDNVVLTAAHAVQGAATGWLDSGSIPVDYDLAWVDPDVDLALVCPRDPMGVEGVEVSMETPQLGEDVTAVGFPLGLRQPVVTRGQVMDHTRGELVHDAPVAPGASGGALLNDAGELVGIITGGDALAGKYAAIDLSTVRSFLQRGGPSPCG